MKKYSLLLVITMVCVSLSAQTETTSSEKNEKFFSKRGVYIFPEKGEFSIGVDALPLLKYAGNLFAGSNNNDPEFTYGSRFNSTTQAIYAKKMIADNMAIRARLGIRDLKTSYIYPVELSSITPNPLAPQYGDDKEEGLDQAVYLSAGLEKRRGKGRVQGIYGAEVLFGYYKYQANYLYANSITSAFNQPVIHNSYNNGQRVIEDNQTQSYFTGLRGFVGVEYFFAPKVSIGGEFGYSLIFEKRGSREMIYEYWDGAKQKVSTVSTKTSNGSFKAVGLDTDNLSGAINLFFYF
jgi:hypothetical protein